MGVHKQVPRGGGAQTDGTARAVQGAWCQRPIAATERVVKRLLQRARVASKPTPPVALWPGYGADRWYESCRGIQKAALEAVGSALTLCVRHYDHRRPCPLTVLLNRDDPTIVRATAYCLVVEPIAGARPAVTSMQLLNTKLEKGLDDK